MILWIFLFYTLGSCFGKQQIHKVRFQLDTNAGQVSTRLLRLMRSYYEDANQRITELNVPRFMYEESSAYEQGYVMHEIIERYKKLVEHLHYAVDYKTVTVYDSIERAEIIQKLYFEIYHLANMMHEIPKKRNASLIFEAYKAKEHAEAKKHEEAMIEMEKQRAREKKKRMRMLKKRRKVIKTLPKVMGSAKRDPYNPHWPLDYGWEVDHF